MKSETSFRVFFLKQHRKNSLKNIFFPSESVFLDFSFWPQGHRSTQNAHCALPLWKQSLHALDSRDKAKNELKLISCCTQRWKKVNRVYIVLHSISRRRIFCETASFAELCTHTRLPPLCLSCLRKVWRRRQRTSLMFLPAFPGREETSINSGSNVRAKITNLLINGDYTQNKRGDETFLQQLQQSH